MPKKPASLLMPVFNSSSSMICELHTFCTVKVPAIPIPKQKNAIKASKFSEEVAKELGAVFVWLRSKVL